MIRRKTVRKALLPAVSGLLLVAFVGAMGAGAVLRPEPRASTLDGRDLRALKAPTLSTLRNGSWMTSTEAWLDDHVPGRGHWLELHGRLVRQGLQQRVINNVYVGDPHGQLLENVPKLRVPSYLAPNAAALGQAVRATGSQLLTVYVPRKEEVFGDRLPAAWPRTIAPVKPSIVSALEGAGPFLDLTPTLANPAKRDSYFWRTDHHWTSQGAIAGLDAIAAKAATMGVDIPPDTRPMTLHTYKPFYGSIGREVTSGGTPQVDTFAALEPATWRARYCANGLCNQLPFQTAIANSQLKYANRYNAFAGGDFGFQTFENPSPQAHGTVLLIKDSFGNALSTYLAERVSKLVTIDERSYTGPDIATEVAAIHPELVILMHNPVTLLGNGKFTSFAWVDMQKTLALRSRAAANPNDG